MENLGIFSITAPPELPDPVEIALAEDISGGDLSSFFFIAEGSISSASIVAREACTVAGLDVAGRVFRLVDDSLGLRFAAKDGAKAEKGETVLFVEGSTRSILMAERTALNFLQRLSAVATLTAKFVGAVEGTGARILDTRKTTPGLRALEKQAVLAGGGSNHRMGLYDRVMLKDNHLASLGSIETLADAVKEFRFAHPEICVEIEADTVEQAFAFFAVPGVDVILLDNMNLEEMRLCVENKPAGLLLEASGGITLETVRAVAETGVDFISVGAITHSAGSVDYGLDF